MQSLSWDTEQKAKNVILKIKYLSASLKEQCHEIFETLFLSKTSILPS